MVKEEELSGQLRTLLRQYGLRAKKSLGQHFLVDDEVLHRIVSAARLAAGDTVIEVGPGLGVLTGELVKRAGRVIAVEADHNLASLLSKNTGSPVNLSVVNSDILKTDPASLLASDSTPPGQMSYKVVANIPYYITGPILRHFLEASLKPDLMVVMVQKEVGEAIVAQPGDMSILAVSVQFYGKPRIVDHVPAQSFYPPPKVDSVILQIEVYKQPAVPVPDAHRFFEVVRAGFSAPRKQLRNALALGLKVSSQEATDIIQRAEISPQRRAETLDLGEWARICEVVTNNGTAVQI